MGSREGEVLSDNDIMVFMDRWYPGWRELVMMDAAYLAIKPIVFGVKADVNAKEARRCFIKLLVTLCLGSMDVLRELDSVTGFYPWLLDMWGAGLLDGVRRDLILQCSTHFMGAVENLYKNGGDVHAFFSDMKSGISRLHLLSGYLDMNVQDIRGCSNVIPYNGKLRDWFLMCYHGKIKNCVKVNSKFVRVLEDSHGL